MKPARTVTSGEVDLAVFESGDPAEPTVLLVHGYPDTHIVWDDVVPALSGRYHVVAYDVRGAGASGAPAGRMGYHLRHLAADLFAVADAVSPSAPVHVVAHDWGSIQAWEAVTTPGAEERIASYTSISGPCLDHVGHWIRRRLTRPTPRRLRQMLGQQLQSWYIAAFHSPVTPLVWKGALAARWGRLLELVEDVPRRPGHPAPTLKEDAVRGMRLYKTNMIPRLLDPRDRPTRVPVQVIQPTRDHFVGAGLAEDLERWVPRLWRRTIAAKHWVPLTHGAKLAEMISEFTAHVDGAPATRALARAAVGGRSHRRYEGHLVVVTGGGSGIGRATAAAFAKRGADVIVCDRDQATAEETARSIGGHAYQVDVSSEKAVNDFAASVAAGHGVPDIVVNNAGIGHSGSFLDTTVKEWERVLDVNLWGVIYGCRAFGAMMAERGEGGHIVNIASAAAYTPAKVLTAYSTSKAAVLMLSECLRAELAGSGIGVSAICPGLVNTNITRTSTFSGLSEEEQRAKRDQASRLYALRNYGPEGVASEILRAVERDRAVVPVTPEATVLRLLSRVSPAALRAGARLDLV